ncbi:MAG: polysaccharide deacetylase family protein [Sphaerochaeta sp.]|nr:polysaccharide deacetylase family protein [Sphaerochaeta sp.]
MKLRIYKRVLFPVLASLFFLFSGFLLASTLPEESSAPLDVSSTPSVRYWISSSVEGLPVRTVQSLEVASVVPQRQDPKLLVVLYHNIVFGRTGNIYNRDLYNFEHDIAFYKRNFTLTDFQALQDPDFKDRTDRLIITFDDGDLSIYGIVYPLLKLYEVPATFFLVPNFVGEVGYMSWDQIREMASYRTASGEKLFTFESHSLTHRRLAELSEKEIRDELLLSKEIIEKEVGESVTVIALPFGSGAGDKKIQAIASELGYTMIRNSKPMVTSYFAPNLLDLGSFNVESYSTDVLVQRVLHLLGR